MGYRGDKLALKNRSPPEQQKELQHPGQGPLICPSECGYCSSTLELACKHCPCLELAVWFLNQVGAVQGRHMDLSSHPHVPRAGSSWPKSWRTEQSCRLPATNSLPYAWESGGNLPPEFSTHCFQVLEVSHFPLAFLHC